MNSTKELKIVDPVTGLRRLFYAVSPNETSFATLSEVPDYVNEAMPYFAVLIVLEYIISWLTTGKTFRINDGISSMSAGVVSQLPLLLARAIELSSYIWVHNNYRITTIPWDNVSTWIIGFIGVELGYYWVHRMAHEVNLFWGGHQVHHSSEAYDLTTALRQSLFQRFFSWFFYLPMALFVPPSVYSVHAQFNLIYQFWIHTEVIRSLGPLEWILNTPSHHRVHHGRNPYCIDKNYGGTLIIFDRIFGTFQAELPSDEEPLAYGLVHPLTTWDPVEIQLCHFKYLWQLLHERKGLYIKWQSLWNGPGWMPGTPRLGNPADLPAITGPVPFYNPSSPNWVKTYSIVHFFLILGLHQAVLLVKIHLSVFSILLTIVYFVVALTGFGNMMDSRTVLYGASIELIRCAIAIGGLTYIHMLAHPAIIISETTLVFLNSFFLISIIIISFYVKSLINTSTKKVK